MAPNLASRSLAKLWTSEDYYAAAETGRFDGSRVELIDGEVITMSPMGARHANALMVALKAVSRAFGESYLVRAQSPLDINDSSQPEPDLAVVKDLPEEYPNHPKTALLVIEISDSSATFDLTVKPGLYASGSIQDYWVIDLVSRALVCHRRPVADPQNTFGYRYDSITRFTMDDSLAPLAIPTASIPVARLFPPGA